MSVLRVALLLISVISVSACSSSSIGNRLNTAKSIVDQTGLTPVMIKTKKFSLVSFQKIRSKEHELTLYIEGDGFAWIDRYTISNNPTPINPVGLKIAAVDASMNVVYLPRPCQYVNLEAETYCHNQYWTSHRFSNEVIQSYNQALDQLAKKYNVTGFHLVGFSGGGAVATLLSAHRSDVLSLRTVAGNLDHVALNKFRNVSQLTGSLNPASYANQLKKVPQIHYSGGDDEVVPSWVAVGFVRKVSSPCAKSKIISGVGHMDGWEQVWPRYASQIPTC